MQIDQEILNRIDALAEKLGVTAEYAFREMVAYERVSGVTAMLTALVGASLTILLVMMSKRIGHAFGAKDEGEFIAPLIASLIASFILPICFVEGGSALRSILAPEGAVLQSIFRG